MILKRSHLLMLPDKRHIQDGVKLLEELGAFEIVRTKAGREASINGCRSSIIATPCGSTFSEDAVEAVSQGALHEVMIIVAALSIQDPRERPTRKQQASDENIDVLLIKIRFLGILKSLALSTRTTKELSKKPIPSSMPKGFLKLFTYS